MIRTLAVATTFALAPLAFQPTAQAEEHLPGKIQGAGVELFERDHTFAGAIADTPVFGVFDEATFTARVEMRVNGKTLTLELAERGDGHYDGSVIGGERTTKIEFVKMAKTGEREGVITIAINGVETPVKVVGESFENSHFHGPTYEAQIGGKTVAFKFTGQACFGYSVNLSMMILGAYAHLTQ